MNEKSPLTMRNFVCFHWLDLVLTRPLIGWNGSNLIEWERHRAGINLWTYDRRSFEWAKNYWSNFDVQDHWRRNRNQILEIYFFDPTSGIAKIWKIFLLCNFWKEKIRSIFLPRTSNLFLSLDRWAKPKSLFKRSCY